MAESTFPAVKAYLLDKLIAAPGLAQVQVDYGVPRGDPETRHIFLGGTGEEDDEWVALGNAGEGDIDEIYSIELWVYLARPGDDQREATEAAHDLFATVRSTVRAELRNADKIVAQPAFVWNLLVAKKSVVEYVLTEGRGCLVSGEIRVSARI